MKNFNVALVGCGGISANHLNALKKLADVNVVALCDIVKEHAQERRSRFGLESKIYESYEEMLECEKLDAVHITTPHYLHFPMAKAALLRGINVVLEKPTCISKEELKELIDIEKKSSATVCVCYQTRFNPTTLLAKKLVAEDGGVEHACASVFWNRDEAYYASGDWRGKKDTEGGGVLINQAIHTLDLLCGFMGRPESVTATTANHHLKGIIDVEDSAEGTIYFESGKKASFYATTSFDGPDNTSVVLYTKNHRIQMQMDKLYLDGDRINDPSLSSTYIGKQVYGNGHECLIAKFYEALEQGEKAPVQLEESQYALRVLLTAYASNDVNMKV